MHFFNLFLGTFSFVPVTNDIVYVTLEILLEGNMLLIVCGEFSTLNTPFTLKIMYLRKLNGICTIPPENVRGEERRGRETIPFP